MSVDRLCAYYGFSRVPFGRDIPPSALYRSTAHQEAVARLSWLIDERGFGILTGEVGAGKSVAVRATTSTLDPSRHQAIYYTPAEIRDPSPRTHPPALWGLGPVGHQLTPLSTTCRYAGDTEVDEGHPGGPTPKRRPFIQESSMRWSPVLTRVVHDGHLDAIVLGHPLLDDYLGFVGARLRQNSWLATAFDLKVFFSVTAKEPVMVTTADVFTFIQAQRRPRLGPKVVRLE